MQGKNSLSRSNLGRSSMRAATHTITSSTSRSVSRLVSKRSKAARANSFPPGTDVQISEENGVKAFAGLVPDLFAGDSEALRKFRTALAQEGRFAAEAWKNRKNFFGK